MMTKPTRRELHVAERKRLAECDRRIAEDVAHVRRVNSKRCRLIFFEPHRSTMRAALLASE
jgi:hypothetical protein